MEKVIIIRVGELFLKGKNRGIFERLLINNIKEKLLPYKCEFIISRNRFFVCNYNNENEIINALKEVFGIHSLSSGVKVVSTIENIEKAAISLSPPNGTFRITTNRGDKTFALNSMQLSMHLGEVLLKKRKRLKVDLHTPQATIFVDVREEGHSLIYRDVVLASGGMPVGSSGKGLLLLSGGIDSPVAAYLMAKRGMSISALHFHSHPYTSNDALEKVKELKTILEKYCKKIDLYIVPFTAVQEAINKYCSSRFSIAILRRCMMVVAEKIAEKIGAVALINGESLGQVASQTIESMNCTNNALENILTLRPLVGLDKQEIIEIAKKIGTYETSVLPFEDCCTVFLPEKPIIRPKIKECLFEERKIPNLEKLLEDAECIMN